MVCLHQNKSSFEKLDFTINSRTKVMMESINVIIDDRGWNVEEDVSEDVGTSFPDSPTELNDTSIDSNPPKEDPQPSHLNKGPSIRT